MNPNVAAILVEPIQGESGIHLPPSGYLRGIEALCKKHNVLFVCDEIQSGLGRTGKFFCFQHEGVRPDIVIVGKALSGGFYPVSAILADDPVMLVLKPGDHGSTFGGNPLACAAGIAAINVTLSEDLPGQATRKGKKLMGSLIRLKMRFDRIIHEVRGRGLLLGIEFANTEIGYKVVSGLFRRGVLVAGTLTNSKVVRIEPALNIPDKLLSQVVDALEDTLKEVDEAMPDIQADPE